MAAAAIPAYVRRPFGGENSFYAGRGGIAFPDIEQNTVCGEVLEGI